MQILRGIKVAPTEAHLLTLLLVAPLGSTTFGGMGTALFADSVATFLLSSPHN